MEKDIFEELAEQQKQRDIDNAASTCNIFVSRVITYGFDETQVSQISKKINDAIFKEAILKNPDFDQFEAPVGVELYNAGMEPMKVIAPCYEKQADGSWVGHDEEVTLQEDERVAVPMKYAILHLMKYNPSGLKVINGEFVPMSTSVDLGKDLDAIMNNYVFRLQSVGPFAWQKENREYWKMIQGHIVSPTGNYMGMSIPEKEYQKRFGYLLNVIPYKDKANIKVKNSEPNQLQQLVANMLYSK